MMFAPGSSFVGSGRWRLALLAAICMSLAIGGAGAGLARAQETKETKADKTEAVKVEAAKKVEGKSEPAAPVSIESDKPADKKQAPGKDELETVIAKASPIKTAEVPKTSAFSVFVVFALVVVASFILGIGWARAAGLGDSGGRFVLVVFSVLASLAITLGYWPPKKGIDLSGGSILNYRIDRTRTEAAQINMEELVGAISKRINPGGTKEVTVRPYGSDEIEIIIPDATQEELASIKRMITSLGALEFRITANERDHASIIAAAEATTNDKVFVKGSDGTTQKLVARWVPLSKDTTAELIGDTRLKKRVTSQGVNQALVVVDDQNVTGDFLLRASQGVDRHGNASVEFVFNSEGANRFSQLTGRNLPDRDTGFHRQLAILLDGALYSCPNVNDTIYDRGEISGMNDVNRVKEQIRVLEAGRLPAALYQEPTSELYIGPTLGRDTIEKGVRSMLIATGAVIVFMLIYYRFAGVVANIAVVLNVLITVALMMLFKAAFTLSGLAGLALTVGMAVDANVLIYERMREELQRRATLRMAIRNGFDRASTTIIDANVTTLIAGVVLYWIGSDQVKGFAVTLIIGLLANLFTAITVSRAIFDTAEKLRWVSTLKMMQMWTTTNIDFIGKRVPAITLSVVIIAIGMVGVFVRGKGILDIDFTGGTSVQVLFDTSKEPHDIADVRKAVEDLPDVTVQDVTLGNEKKGYRYLIVTSKPNSVTNSEGLVVEEGVVEKQLHATFKGQLAANMMTISDAKSLPGSQPAKPAAKQGAALTADDENLLAFAPEALLAQAETKTDAAKSDAPKADAAKTETKAATPPATDAVKPEANVTPVDAFAGGAQVTLNFSEAIGQEILSGLINKQLKVSNQENTAFELVDPKEQQGATSAYKQWTLKIALPQAEATKVLETIRRQMIEEPFFPASSQVGAAVAGTTQQQALVAMALSLALILAYVWFRFSQATFGIAAVVAVIHDVLVTLGALALSYWLTGPLGFLGVDPFKINLPIIAAFLTIIGYSLNDTIVIFDRIREIRGKSHTITPQLVNLSINQTLSRTILTSLTVFITVLILYILGGQGIHGFAFALVIGSIAGAYSTIYIATPLVLWLQGWKGETEPAVKQVTQAAS